MKFGEVTEKEMRKIENTALLINLFATLLNSIAIICLLSILKEAETGTDLVVQRIPSP